MSERNLNKSMDALFPQVRKNYHEEVGIVYTVDESICRVCGEDVVDGRWSYCSVRCRELANAVQRAFLWREVRKRVLRRDDHTCQICGVTRDELYDEYHEWREEKVETYDDAADREEVREITREIEQRRPSLHVDHIEPISEGGNKFDESNLRTLCAECHREKTSGGVDEETDPSPEHLPIGEYA